MWFILSTYNISRIMAFRALHLKFFQVSLQISWLAEEHTFAALADDVQLVKQLHQLEGRLMNGGHDRDMVSSAQFLQLT